MSQNKSGQDRMHEVCLRAEKVASFSQEDFRKIVPEVQSLLRRLVQHLNQAEKEKETLRRTQDELEAAQKQCVDLYDFAPVGYITLDKRGVITNVNITARDMLNAPADRLVNADFASLVEPDYRGAFASYLKEIADTGQRLSTELELARTDGTTFYAQLQTVALYEKSNIAYRVSVADVTERKKLEEARWALDKRYRSFIEVTGELGWTTNADGEVVEDIPSFRQFTGQSYEEVRGWGWSKALHPDDLETTKRVWQKAVNEKSKYETEYRLRRYDGVYRHFLARGVPVFREDSSILEWVGTCIDIAERKKMETELAHIASIPELNPNPIVELDATGNLNYVNPAAKASLPDMAQVGSAHSFTQNWQALLNKLRGEKLNSLTREVEVGASWYIETVAYVPVSQTLRFYGRDITERKRAEQALKEGEQKYRELADSLAEGVFETDLSGNVTYANKRALASHGVSIDDLSNGVNIFEYIAPQSIDFARERFARVLQQEDIGTDEYVLRRKDGATFPALVHSLALVREGKVQGIRGIVIDITEQKRGEQALKESENRLRTTLDAMLEGCQIIDFNWRYTYVNDAVARQGRRSREELLGHTMMEMYPGIDKTELFGHLRNCMENRVPHHMENEFTFPDGSKGWFELRIEPVPEGILILSVDITERKRSERPTGRAAVR